MIIRMYLDGHELAGALEPGHVALPDRGRAQRVLGVELLEHLVCPTTGRRQMKDIDQIRDGKGAEGVD
jgi:hypothetical protein